MKVSVTTQDFARLRAVSGWAVRIAPLATVLLPAVVMASGGGHGESLEGHGPSAGQWTTLGLTIVNFSIFIFLFWRSTKAPLADFLTSRRDEIEEAMSRAAIAKAEADKIKAEYEAKAAALDGMKRELVEELSTRAANDRAKTLAAVEQAAERLLEDASRTADSDLERAHRELRAEASRLAADIAAKDIEARLSESDRGRLVKDFLDGVGA